jgi:dTDP-4-amino-4,6-dideoxygalactose transaminase
MLLVSEPVLGADEKAALAAVIDSGWVTMGDRVHEFESSSRQERTADWWHRRLAAKPGMRERDLIT